MAENSHKPWYEEWGQVVSTSIGSAGFCAVLIVFLVVAILSTTGCSGDLTESPEWIYKESTPVLIVKKDTTLGVVDPEKIELGQPETEGSWPALSFVQPAPSDFAKMMGVDDDSGLAILPPQYLSRLSDFDDSFGRLGLFRVDEVGASGKLRGVELAPCETAVHFFEYVFPRPNDVCAFIGGRQTEVVQVKRKAFPDLGKSGATFLVQKPGEPSSRLRIDLAVEMPRLDQGIPRPYWTYRVVPSQMELRVRRVGKDMPGVRLTDLVTEVTGWAAGEDQCENPPCNLKTLGLAIHLNPPQETDIPLSAERLVLWGNTRAPSGGSP